MDANAFYYTYSTICQTLAGAFGFLVAVVLYQIQSVTAGFEVMLNEAGKHRIWPDEDKWLSARAIHDWDTVARLLRDSPIPVDRPDWERRRMQVFADHFTRDVGHLKSVKIAARRSSQTTFAVIALSLILLPFGKLLAERPVLGSILLSFALGLAIVSAWSYVRLILKLLGTPNA
jgi:hypothetical protein